MADTEAGPYQQACFGRIIILHIRRVAACDMLIFIIVQLSIARQVALL